MDVVVAQTMGAPEAVAFSGLVVMIMFVIGSVLATFVGLRKAKLAAGREDDLRQLVRRYEHSPRPSSTRSSGWPATSPMCARARARSSRSCGR